jgi:hypothetical protein
VFVQAAIPSIRQIHDLTKPKVGLELAAAVFGNKLRSNEQHELKDTAIPRTKRL